MADFKLGRIKFKWRGNWATSTAYLIDDVVKYGGNTYVVTANHTSPANENLFYTSPGTYTNYWSLRAEALSPNCRIVSADGPIKIKLA